MRFHKTNTISQIGQLFKMYWHQVSGYRKWGLLAMVIITAAVQVLSLVALNDEWKYLFNALQAYDYSRFIEVSAVFLLTILIIALSYAFNNYAIGLFSLRWRAYLTDYIKDTWITQNQSQHTHNKKTIDNPEQRITDDLNLVPTLVISIGNQLCQAMMSLCIFGAELWIFSKQWQFPYHHHILQFPGIYLWVTLIYALFFNGLVFSLGHKLISLNYNNQRLTANMRYTMSVIRQESQLGITNIAMHQHRKKTDTELSEVIHNTLSLLKVDRWVQLVKQISFNACGFVVILIALPVYFANHLSLGSLMQLNGAAIFFVQALSVLMIAYENIAILRASLQRVVEFVQSLTQVAEPVLSAQSS